MGIIDSPTATGQQSYTTGFQPKALIIYSVDKVAGEAFTSQHRIGIGFATGSAAERAVWSGSQDALASSNTKRERTESQTILITDENTGFTFWAADLVSFDANGFTLNWSIVSGSSRKFYYVALGGTDLTNQKAGTFTLTTGTGNLSVTDPGFQPDFVMFLWTFTEGLGITTDNSEMGVGFATGPANEGASMLNGEDARATTDTWRFQRNDRSILLTNPATGAVDAEVEFTQFTAMGFDLNKIDGPAAATPIFYLALQGGSYSVGSFTQPAATGNQGVTGTGFTPKVELFASYNQTAQTVVQTNLEWMFGAAETSTKRHCVWVGDLDGAADSDANRNDRQTKCLLMASNPATLDAEADFVTQDSNGFTVNWTTVNQTDARQILYAAFGDEPVPAPPLQFINQDGVEVA